jgi:hypothetical protein
MRLPEHPADISGAYLERCAEPLLERQVGSAALRSLAPISTGTSGDEVYELVVSVDDQPLRLILKLNEPGEVAETLFYRDLRESVPVDTPRIADARLLGDGRGWILMERVGGRDHETWIDDDYRSVVEAMAAVPSHQRCKSGEGVGSFKSYQLTKETYTHASTSIAH